MRGIEIVVLALPTESRLHLCHKLKIMTKWASDGDRQNLRENGSEGLVTKAVTFGLELLLVSGTGALELLPNLFKKLLHCLWDDLEGRTI